MNVLEAGRFYGETRSQRAAGVTLSVVVHRKRREVEQHVHACPFFCLLLEGHYAETSGPVTIQYEPLTLVFHPARIAHADTVGDDSRMFTVELEERWHSPLEALHLPDVPLYSLSGAAPLWTMLRLYDGMRAGALTPLVVESLVFELLAYVDQLEPQERSERPEWLDVVRTYLDEHAVERMTIVEVAKIAHVHPAHLARVFRHALKTTVGDYVARRRVQMGCRLLAETRQPISAIASELGFVDQSHFHRVFRALVGQTPAAFRKSARPDGGGADA